MSESIYESVLARLEKANRPLREIADEAGVPYSTLTRIKRRQTKRPSWQHIEALDRYLSHGRRKAS
jgi:hypothetical protein